MKRPCADCRGYELERRGCSACAGRGMVDLQGEQEPSETRAAGVHQVTLPPQVGLRPLRGFYGT